jgi:hypothetical protein
MTLMTLLPPLYTLRMPDLTDGALRTFVVQAGLAGDADALRTIRETV